MLIDPKITLLKHQFFFHLFYAFSDIPIKIPEITLGDIDALILNSIRKNKGSGIVKITLRSKTKISGLLLSDFMTYYETKIILKI
jgi:hypothetical protein